MSDEVVLQLTKDDGSVEQHPEPHASTKLSLFSQRLVDISDNIAELTRVTTLLLHDNALTAIPTGVFAMTPLVELNLSHNRLVAVPPEIGRLTALTNLFLGLNALVTVPREIGRLTALTQLGLSHNALTAVPPELGWLSSLFSLFLHNNRLTWLPLELDRLPPTTELYLNGNPLPIDVGPANAFPPSDSRDKLPELFAATTALAMIRDPAIVILTALQDLDLPALLLVDILDAAFPNSIRMHAKWELVTAVKHYHQRLGIER